MFQTFSEETLHELYDFVARKDKDLKRVIKEYGYSPVWIRPNSFESWVLTILEQQVSLASAYL